jgi:hypothetical protein
VEQREVGLPGEVPVVRLLPQLPHQPTRLVGETRETVNLT